MGRYVRCALPNTTMIESLDGEGASVIMKPILYEVEKVSNNGYEGSHVKNLQRCGDGMQIKETNLIMQSENEN